MRRAPGAVKIALCEHCATASSLTALLGFPISGGGTPLPTEGRLSGRIGHDLTDPRRAAACAAFFVWTLRQTPWMERAKSCRRLARPLASLQARQSET